MATLYITTNNHYADTRYKVSNSYNDALDEVDVYSHWDATIRKYEIDDDVKLIDVDNSWMSYNPASKDRYIHAYWYMFVPADIVNNTEIDKEDYHEYAVEYKPMYSMSISIEDDMDDVEYNEDNDEYYYTDPSGEKEIYDTRREAIIPHYHRIWELR